jgi:hypothetical protein
MKPAEHVRADVTDDGLVVLDIDNGQIFGANAIAARIWQDVVVGNKRKEEVVDSIVRDWGGVPDVVARDLETFVAKLKQQALVIEA